MASLSSPQTTELTRYILSVSAALFLGHGFGAIPAPGSFADSALFGSSQKISEHSPTFVT